MPYILVKNNKKNILKTIIILIIFYKIIFSNNNKIERMTNTNYYKSLFHRRKCDSSCCITDITYLPNDLKKNFNNSYRPSGYSCSKGCICLENNKK